MSQETQDHQEWVNQQADLEEAENDRLYFLTMYPPRTYGTTSDTTERRDNRQELQVPVREAR